MEKGAGDHGHQGVSMESSPGSAFEVGKAEFLLQLLMSCSQIHPALVAAASIFWLASAVKFHTKYFLLASHRLSPTSHPVLMTIRSRTCRAASMSAAR